MKIAFLGTAAATSYPLAFCQCDYCKHARSNGGKDIRKRASIVVNNDLLIDFGPDTVNASLMYNKPLTDIRYILQTHPHSDHFDASHLSTRIPEYMGVNIPPIEIYGTLQTINKMSEMMRIEGYIKDLLNPEEQARLKAKITPISLYTPFDIGNYSITAIPTNHDQSVDSVLYLITEGGKTAFYGTDTDSLSEEVWKYFTDNHVLLDFVILDHTYGLDADSGGHLNTNRFIEHIQKLKHGGLLKPDSRILATHISHEGNPTHDKLSEFAHNNGYEIAFDGLEI